jgi:hypothetical protein
MNVNGFKISPKNQYSRFKYSGLCTIKMGSGDYGGGGCYGTEFAGKKKFNALNGFLKK